MIPSERVQRIPHGVWFNDQCVDDAKLVGSVSSKPKMLSGSSGLGLVAKPPLTGNSLGI